MTHSNLYQACGGFELCPALVVRKFSAVDLERHEVLRGLRWSAYQRAVRPADWLDYSTDLYRDFPGVIRDACGKEVALDMTPL